MRYPNQLRVTLIAVVAAGIALLGMSCPQGLKPGAFVQLNNAGVFKYLGDHAPVSSIAVGDGWVRHDYDVDGGDGPLCIDGSPYAVFTRAGSDPSKLLILEQGGGACWQDFYNCNVDLGDNALPPVPQVDAVGLWNRSNPGNPFADHSLVYLPYCDGSVFSGDNDVADANFPFGPIRFHRGLRNQSAGITLAKQLFGDDVTQVTLAGSSAGGVGVAGFAAFLVRAVFGNSIELTVFNDAGPVAVNLDPSQQPAIAARAADWQFGQFYPASCHQCDEFGQATGVIDWRLKNDVTIREVIYETDADLTNRFFLGLLGDQPAWRNLIITEHGFLNEDYPDRYKRFFVAGDISHTALQSGLFYTQTADGVLLNEWAADFLADSPDWIDIVEAP